MEEPYAKFGAFNPTGHAAIYLNHVCAESPTRLRPCHPGEPGAVISRYHKIDGYDWLAIPLVPYLYAVERVEDVPTTADAELEAVVNEALEVQELEVQQEVREAQELEVLLEKEVQVQEAQLGKEALEVQELAVNV